MLSEWHDVGEKRDHSIRQKQSDSDLFDLQAWPIRRQN
jgi:hypothetical protein